MKRAPGSKMRTTTAGPRLRCFLSVQACFQWICISAVLFTPASVLSQSICVPTKNGSLNCKEEKVSSNLVVLNATTVRGTFKGPTGAPIQFNRTIVQVRSLDSQAILASEVLDRQGRFDLGDVPAGRFRWIVFQQQGSKIHRLPLFDQPRPVSCSGKQAYRLDVVLTMHGTDQPFESCPPE